MVKKCFICGTSFKKGNDLSFHTFPKNLECRKMWFTIFGIDTMFVPKYASVCSAHFKDDDFTIKPTGIKYLKDGAIPIKSHNSNIPPTKLKNSNIVASGVAEAAYYSDEDTLSGDSVVNADDSSESEIVFTSSGLHDSPSKSSSTIPDTNCDLLRVKDAPDFRKKKMKYTRYFGDLTSYDETIPYKDRKEWEVTKATVAIKRQVMKNLQRQNKRLKDRITRLSLLLKFLNE